jgi:hypothetical protein
LALKLDSKSVSNSVSGYIIGVNLPFVVGLAYESYAADLDKKKTGGVSTKYDVHFADLVFNLPIPVINLAIGAGIGSAHFDPDDFAGAGTKAKDASLTQYLVSVGIPIAHFFDVHLGYRTFSGKHDGSGGLSSFDTKGQLLTLGGKVGF